MGKANDTRSGIAMSRAWTLGYEDFGGQVKELDCVKGLHSS